MEEFHTLATRINENLHGIREAMTPEERQTHNLRLSYTEMDSLHLMNLSRDFLGWGNEEQYKVIHTLQELVFEYWEMFHLFKDIDKHRGGNRDKTPDAFLHSIKRLKDEKMHDVASLVHNLLSHYRYPSDKLDRIEIAWNELRRVLREEYHYPSFRIPYLLR
jgi:hypothetical protein